jgi:transposase-like zinc-binding protein
VDAAVAGAYRPRDGTAGVLHGVVRDHLEEFLALATRHGDGTGMPRFVEQELRRFLGCGVLAHGFARVRCDGCGFERFVPFSCKGRGFCPSCGGRRMAERAAHLTDNVLPAVGLRQWVLTVPHTGCAI